MVKVPEDALTVEKLIEFLKTHPREMLVVYSCRGEKTLLTKEDVQITLLGEYDENGFVSWDSEKGPNTEYLVFQ